MSQELAGRPLRVLFFMRNFRGYLRVFEPALRALGQAGHRVHLAYDDKGTPEERQWAEDLGRELPSITWGPTPDRRNSLWFGLSRNLRLSTDYVRFLRPEFANAPDLRERAARRAPRTMVAVTRLPCLRTPKAVDWLTRVLKRMEQALPSDPDVEAFIASYRPDAVLLTPLLSMGSPQSDYLKSAQALGMRTMLCVASWDNLSSKSQIRFLPDVITVWNETQKREAVELHGVPADRVVVTGAQVFDPWFGWRARPREEFCKVVGLPADRPYVLYACSCLFAASMTEAEFVVRWIRALRSAPDPSLRGASILIRPHPKRNHEWENIDLSEFENVVLWPRVNVMPVAAQARADYYDSMYHSAAVVALNTSAMIEAGIVGRAVHTVLTTEFAGSQGGTLHFRYLMDVEGGLLRVAHSLEEHLEQLGEAVAGGNWGQALRERFLQAFVRPFGLDVPASPLFVDAVESLTRREAPVPVRRSAADRVICALMFPLALRSALARRLRNAPRVLVRRGRKARRALARRLRNARRALARRLRNGSSRLSRIARAGPPRAVAREFLESMRRSSPAGRPATRAARSDQDEVKQALRRLGRNGRPVVVGPWLGEVGFELLYWIPFLRWAKRYAALDESRLVAVSRGGAGCWYAGLCSRYEDILNYYSAAEFNDRNQERMRSHGGHQKQHGVSSFDREILDRVRATLGTDEIDILHPLLMYRLLDGYWRGGMTVKMVRRFTEYQPIAAPRCALPPVLPAEYVAVKFYQSPAFPGTEANRRFVERILRELTQRIDVVSLDTGLKLDEHVDISPGSMHRVHTISHLVKPADNLDLQTRVIAGARAFVGTYGGFAYLAPLCKVDCLAFYADLDRFRPHHLELARRVLRRPDFGALVALGVDDVPLVELGLTGRKGVVTGA